MEKRTRKIETQCFEDLVALALQPVNDFLSDYDGPEAEHAKVASIALVLNKTALAQLDKLVGALEKHLGGTVAFHVMNDSLPVFDFVGGAEIIRKPGAADFRDVALDSPEEDELQRAFEILRYGNPSDKKILELTIAVALENSIRNPEEGNSFRNAAA